MLVLTVIAGGAAGTARGDASFTCSMTITDATGQPVATAHSGERLTYTITVTSSDATALVPGLVNFWTTASDQVGDDGELTAINGNTGSGSVTTASLHEGTWAVYGQYRQVFGGPTCRTPTVPMSVLGPGGTMTTTEVTGPGTVDRYSSITLTATVTQTGNPTAPVGGNVIFSVASPQVHLGDPTPLLGNTATLQTPIILPAGTYTILALYSGDLADGLPQSSGETTIVVRDTSLLTYHGDSTVRAGKQATLGATLVDSDGNAISNEPVTLSVQGTTATCTTTTDANGVASCRATVDATAGTYTTVADYQGSEYFKSTQAFGTIDVTPGPTAIVYDGDRHAIVGRNATLSATLTTEDGAPIANAPVQLSVVGHPSLSCATTTDANGKASCLRLTTLAAGTYEIDAVYAGDPTHYAGSTDPSARMTIVVSVPTTLSYLGPTATQQPGSSVAPQFLLTDDQGNPVPNVSVSITFNGVPTPVTTGADGVAKAPAQTLRLGGSYPVSATFAGAPGFDPSRPASGTVTVAPAPTTLTMLPTAPVLAGHPAALSAKLTDQLDGGGIGGQTVTLGFDGVTCTGVTTSDGLASCTTTATIPGPARAVGTSAVLAASPEVNGASVSGGGIVYAFVSGGGFFVVGDKTAAAQVTFWGAQWAKLNALTGGGAPSAFKGFAGTTTVPTQCGTTWTTRPGNSTPPPAGPLPAYLGVVVSSSIGKNGSAIAGNVVAIVVVRTDRGYASDPGHAGTGAVVATVCP